MREILIEQNKHWDNQKYVSIKRDILDKFISYISLKQIITITGIRRCGKSTLAKQAINYLIESGVAKENIFFINLENPYFLEYKHDAKFLNTIFEEYLKLMNPKGKIYCIFDEIQYFDNWQVYIKSKYESSNIKYIITGSNSSMLSHELATLLSGRSLNIHLDTFSFTEFLDFKRIDYKSEFAQIKNRIDIARAKEEYLKWGGFYEVFEASDEMTKKELLISYVKNIIYQDIIPRYSIRNSEIVERLFFYLLTNIAGVINYTTLAKTFEVSDKTIKEYINYFEDVFLLKRIDKFHNKLKEKIKSTKKIYVLDNGFLQIAPTNSKNLGSSLENGVFVILNKLYDEVTYIKENYEIDFRCADTLYQVSYKMDDEKTRQRELRAYESFDEGAYYKHKVITYDETSNFEKVEIVKFDDFVFGLENKE